MAEWVKNPPAMKETNRKCRLVPWAGKIPTPVFLPEKSHGRRSLVGWSPKDHESDTTEWLSTRILQGSRTSLTKHSLPTSWSFDDKIKRPNVWDRKGAAHCKYETQQDDCWWRSTTEPRVLVRAPRRWGCFLGLRKLGFGRQYGDSDLNPLTFLKHSLHALTQDWGNAVMTGRREVPEYATPKHAQIFLWHMGYFQLKTPEN